MGGLIYLGGFLITLWVMMRIWFQEFGQEWEGVGWALFGSLIWPLTLPIMGMYMLVQWIKSRAFKRGKKRDPILYALTRIVGVRWNGEDDDHTAR